MNFCVAVLISKVKENTPQSQNVMLYFKKGKDTTKMQKKKKLQYMENMLWLTEHV